MKPRNVNQGFGPDGAAGGGGGGRGIAIGGGGTRGGGGGDGFWFPLEICFIVAHFNASPPPLPKGKIYIYNTCKNNYINNKKENK